MANRLFNQFRYGLEKKIVDIYCKAAIGATGAPTLNVASSKGVASIARTGVGAYTITMSDPYVDLMMIQFAFLTAGTNTATGFNIVAVDSKVAKTYQILFVNSAGAAVELAASSTLSLKFELKDSSV